MGIPKPNLFGTPANDPDLSAWWSASLDAAGRADGTQTFDLTSNGHNKTFIGDTAYVADSDGGSGSHAYETSGTGKMRSTGPVPDVNKWTVSFWLKFVAVGAYGVFEFYRDAGDYVRFTIDDNNSRVHCELSAGGGTRYGDMFSRVWDDGLWHHYVVRGRDFTENEIWSDGVKDGDTGGVEILNPPGQITYNYAAATHVEAGNHRTDDFRLFDRYLTDQEIIDLFNAGRSDDGSGPGPPDINVPLGKAGATDTAKAIGVTSELTVLLGKAAKSDTGKALSIDQPAAQTIPIGKAGETSTAKQIIPLVAGVQLIPLGKAGETATAKQITPLVAGVQLIPLGKAGATDTAKQITPRFGTLVRLGIARETSTAYHLILVGDQVVPIGVARETERARNLRPAQDGASVIVPYHYYAM